MKKLILYVSLILMFVAGQASAAPLLEWKFNEPDQAASTPAGTPVDTGAFSGGDGFTTAGYEGGGYLSTLAGNGNIPNGADVFSTANGPVKSISFMVNFDASTFDSSGNFNTVLGESQFFRFDASNGANHGGLYLTETGGDTAKLSTSFGGSIIGGASHSNSVSWAPDTWYELKWEYRDVGQSEAGIKFYRDGVPIGSRLADHTWTASGDIYTGNHPAVDVGLQGVIDNFQITPEPATMMLFGLGGLFLRRRKR